MKCSNCGGQYKTRELKCPYCGTENMLGHLWMAERSEAELEYERARKEAGKKGSIYVVNRVVNRALLISTGMFVLMMLIAFLAFWITDAFGNVKDKMKGDKFHATMQQYYEDEDYEKLYKYMSKYDLFSTEYYDATQAALLYSSYNTFLNRKFEIMDLTKDELRQDNQMYRIVSTLETSVKVYQVDIGIYDEPTEKNQKQYEEYRVDIEAFWRGSLGMSEEQVQMLVTSEPHTRKTIVESVAEEVVEMEAWRE